MRSAKLKEEWEWWLHGLQNVKVSRTVAHIQKISQQPNSKSVWIEIIANVIHLFNQVEWH